jgi:16S rRNA (cytosine967-C5)-methyltransferase
VSVKVATGIKSRRLALNILIEAQKKNCFANVLLQDKLGKSELNDSDKAFVTALVYGVTKHKIHLDKRISSLIDRPIEKLNIIIIQVLRLGLFQLEFMSDIPESAVVNTSCEIAKKAGHKGHSSFVNAVLRTSIRNQAQDSASNSGNQDIIHAQTVDFPTWLQERWQNNFGEKAFKELITYMNTPPQLVLRIDTNKIGLSEFKTRLDNLQVKSRTSYIAESCLIIDSRKSWRKHHKKIENEFKNNYFIQDEGSILISSIVEPKPNERILDMCAAPGSKTIHMAQLAKEQAEIVALDRSQKRLTLLQNTAKMLNLKNIHTFVADGRSYTDSKGFDLVLLDAPCSGTGVMNKKAEIRHLRTAEDLVTLSNLQKELLYNAAKLVKPGGILIYSTCSIEPEENEDNYYWFLEKHSDFQPLSLLSALKDDFIDKYEEFSAELKEQAQKGMLSLAPHRYNTNGYFIARFKKSL